MPKIEVDKEDTEQLYKYTEALEKELSSIGIKKALSHGGFSELKEKTKNTLALYANICGECGLNESIKRKTTCIDFLIKGKRASFPDSSMYDFINLCVKHFTTGFITVKDDNGIDIGFYDRENKNLIIPYDISHHFCTQGMDFLKYIISKCQLLMKTKTMSFEELSTLNHTLCKSIDETTKRAVNEIDTLIDTYSSAASAFITKTKDIRNTIKEEEEKRLQEKYDALITQKIAEKDKVIAEINIKYANAITPNRYLINKLREHGFVFCIIKDSPMFLKKVDVQFTHSSSFGVMVRKIEPPAVMEMYIGASVYNDFSKVLEFKCYKEISPLIPVYGVHFVFREKICLGDGSYLLKNTIEQLPESVNKLLEILSNCSFEHGTSVAEESIKYFPPEILKLQSEYYEYRAKLDTERREREARERAAREAQRQVPVSEPPFDDSGDGSEDDVF